MCGLGTVPVPRCRCPVSSGIAYIDYNVFYYFQRPFYCRGASMPVPVEIGLERPDRRFIQKVDFESVRNCFCITVGNVQLNVIHI